MSSVDASFTFLDRIDEIEANIRDKRWQSALALSLTVPDICGRLIIPKLSEDTVTEKLFWIKKACLQGTLAGSIFCGLTSMQVSFSRKMKTTASLILTEADVGS